MEAAHLLQHSWKVLCFAFRNLPKESRARDCCVRSSGSLNITPSSCWSSPSMACSTPASPGRHKHHRTSRLVLSTDRRCQAVVKRKRCHAAPTGTSEGMRRTHPALHHIRAQLAAWIGASVPEVPRMAIVVQQLHPKDGNSGATTATHAAWQCRRQGYLDFQDAAGSGTGPGAHQRQPPSPLLGTALRPPAAAAAPQGRHVLQLGRYWSRLPMLPAAAVMSLPRPTHPPLPLRRSRQAMTSDKAAEQLDATYLP